jgi:hypothetical protein
MDPLGSIPKCEVEERKGSGKGEWKNAIRERVGVSGGDAVRAGVGVGVRGIEGREEERCLDCATK